MPPRPPPGSAPGPYCTSNFHVIMLLLGGGVAYLSTFENFPGVESARQLVSDILPIARGCYK